MSIVHYFMCCALKNMLCSRICIFCLQVLYFCCIFANENTAAVMSCLSWGGETCLTVAEGVLAITL